MIKDETILRELSRVVNDRSVSHRNRNVAQRALDVINQLMGDEAPNPDQTDIEGNYEAMQTREELQLRMLGVDLD